MKIFIDESGNLGRLGRFFVISAFVPDNSKRIVNIFRRSCVKFSKKRKPLEEIKGSNLSFVEKQEILNKLLKKDDHFVSYVIADLKYIEPKILYDKNICYNFLCNFLFKSLLQNTNEDINVLIDNRTIKVASINSLSDYIRTEAYSKWNFKHDIFFSYMDSKRSKNLQAADLMANIIYQKYTHKKNHLYKKLKIQNSILFPLRKFGS